MNKKQYKVEKRQVVIENYVFYVEAENEEQAINEGWNTDAICDWIDCGSKLVEVLDVSVLEEEPVIAGYTFEVQFEQDPQRDHTWVYEGEKTLQELMIDADEEGENHWNGIVEEAIDEAVFLDPDNEIGSHARFTLVF